jgi:hypothetical protein
LAIHPSDRLLQAVADDHTDGVVLTDRALGRLYHPYEGGAEISADAGIGEQLAADHSSGVGPARAARLVSPISLRPAGR